MAGLSEAEKLNGIVTGVKDHYNEIVKNESASGGESIKPFCVDGAIMQCTMGSAPGKLTVIDHGVAITGKYAAHDEDRVPGTNIPSFGTCAATGKPCAPSPVPKWLLTDEFSLMTNKRGAAATSAENCALITDSILVCMQGGIIKFVTSGQMMTVGDLLEMLKALFVAMQKGGGTGNEGKKPAFTGDDGTNEGKVPPGKTWTLEDWRVFGKDRSYLNTNGVYDPSTTLQGEDSEIFWQEGEKTTVDLVAHILMHEAKYKEDMHALVWAMLNRTMLFGYSNKGNTLNDILKSDYKIFEPSANGSESFDANDAKNYLENHPEEKEMSQYAIKLAKLLCSIADNPTLTNEGKYQILEDTIGMPFKNITYVGKPVVPYFVTYHAALKSEPGRNDYCVEVNFDSYPQDGIVNVYMYDFNLYNSTKKEFNRNEQLVPPDFNWETMRYESDPIGFAVD